MIRFLLLSLSFFAMTGCSTKPAAETPQPAPTKAATDCPGGKLPGTELCQDRAKALLAMTPGAHPNPPKGCEWVVNEVELAGADYLLYLASKCANGKVTTLEYAGGAHKAELTFAVAASAGGPGKGMIIEIHGADEKDPHAAILRAAREVIPNRTVAGKCSVRPANMNGYPSDALVVDVSAEEAAKAPKNEPRTACGRYGLTEDSQRFWRVFQTFSWFFELGQDDVDIDPGSLTMVVRDEKGEWVRSK